uniref:Uncharacterized protein n=1 Tax=Desulfovibrio sp. U5L TaxID=596152 RepID=I2Q577_9BACT
MEKTIKFENLYIELLKDQFYSQEAVAKFLFERTWERVDPWENSDKSDQVRRIMIRQGMYTPGLVNNNYIASFIVCLYYDKNHKLELDCWNIYKEDSIEISVLKGMFKIRNFSMPLPTSIFPEELYNTKTFMEKAFPEGTPNHIQQAIINPNDWEALEKELKGPASQSATIPSGVDTPKTLIARLRGDGINDPYQLAPLVKENFPSQSDADIGELFPANPGRVVGWSAKNARGRRLLGKK